MSGPDFTFDCYAALQARDPRFDGLFFVGVKTTGIYCRSVCAARTPARASCLFHRTAAGAERAGFRPCLRCRPELAPHYPALGQADNGASLEQALYAAIRAHVAQGGAVADLVAVTGFSARQLRRLTVRAFGVTPVEIAQTERLLFAKKLLQETHLPMLDVAHGAGFRSLRRFNALFHHRYRLAPTAIRRQSNPAAADGSARLPRASESGHAEPDLLILGLAYRPPLAWEQLLTYLSRRATPGVECVDPRTGRYGRTVAIGDKTGWIWIGQPIAGSYAASKMAVPMIEVRVPAHLSEALWPILSRLRAVFDLDADPARIDAHLAAADPAMAAWVRACPGLRVPGAWDLFELAVRAVLGQQISVAGATTLAGRLATRFGQPIATPTTALNRLTPVPESLAAANLDDIAAIGIPRTRAKTLQQLARATVRGELAHALAGGIEAATAALRKVSGIGEWTAQYIAMRALRFPDAFPSADLGLRKALAAPGATTLPSEREVLTRAAVWRPWRAYAVMHLWRSLEKPAPSLPPTEEISPSPHARISQSKLELAPTQ